MMTINYMIFLYTFDKMNKDVLCIKDFICIKYKIVWNTRVIMNYPLNETYIISCYLKYPAYVQTDKDSNSITWYDRYYTIGTQKFSLPDCMVKMMNALVNIQVASSTQSSELSRAFSWHAVQLRRLWVRFDVILITDCLYFCLL